MKKKYLLAYSLLILIVLVITVLTFRQNKTQEVLSLKKGAIQESIYGLGKVRSWKEYQLKIGVAAMIEKIYIKEGQKVSQNDKLIKMEGMDVFYAPFAGTVTSLSARVSEIAFAGQSVLTLQSLNELYVEVSFEQEAAMRVKKGQKTDVIFPGERTLHLEGEVSSLYPRNGEFVALINVEKMPGHVLPDMTTDVIISMGKKENVLLIPNRAIRLGHVLRLRDEKTTLVKVEIGHSDGVWSELKEGDLRVDDKVLVKGKI